MKWMTLTAALLVCSSFSSAEAGLFGCCHKNNCCQSSCCETSCCETSCQQAAPCCQQAAPVCQQTCAPSCGCDNYSSCDSGCGCNSGCKKPCFFSKLFSGCHKHNCCQSSCESTCCEQSYAPSCGCDTCNSCDSCNSGCGRKKCSLFSGLFSCHKNKCCQSYDCGCNTCGGGYAAAPACSTCGH